MVVIAYNKYGCYSDVVFKLRDCVPSVKYSRICNVLRLWRISLILTYRIYRPYDSNTLVHITQKLIE